MLELPGVNLKQIVGKGEQPEARGAQLAKRWWHFRIRRHRRELSLEFLLVRIVDFDALRIRHHLHDGGADIGTRYEAAGDRERRRIKDEVSKPNAHILVVAKDALKSRLHRAKVEKRLIDVKDDQWKIGHGQTPILSCFG